jgi:membrane protein implicated in regulation of membrane protease activity
VVIAGGVLSVLRQLFSRTQSSSESKVASLAGMTATVISPIPAGGVGEISYVQAGSRYTAAARLETTDSALANGKLVRITRVVGSQFYVEVTA